MIAWSAVVLGINSTSNAGSNFHEAIIVCIDIVLQSLDHQVITGVVSQKWDCCIISFYCFNLYIHSNHHQCE